MSPYEVYAPAVPPDRAQLQQQRRVGVVVAYVVDNMTSGQMYELLHHIQLNSGQLSSSC